MNDLREKVEKERTLLKKIELAIPEFRGYRKREDLRIADSMLRDYIARILSDVEKYAKITRENIAGEMMLEEMERIGKIVNQVSKIVSEVQHAEEGYMGLVSDYRVDIEQLNNLYEFDVKLIEESQNLLEFARKMSNTAHSEVDTIMQEFLIKLNEFEEVFEKRRDYMLEVFK